MGTVYPAQIDTTQNLPLVVDNLTPITANVFNGLRSAIVAIEQALGVNPAATYSTVGERLSVLENAIGNIKTISLFQDLGGTLSNPLVIGIQGRPISNIAPTLNQVLAWNGIVWAPTSSAISGLIFSQDLSGNGSSQTVIGIQDRPVSSVAPSTGQTFIWGGTTWAPGTNFGNQSLFTTGEIVSGPSLSTSVTTGLINVTGKIIANAIATTATSDHGQGIVYFDNTQNKFLMSQNGGTYTAIQPYFNVKDYGATGDGIIDDTSFIQATLNACDTAGGGVVFLPAGNYKTTSPLIMGNGITIRGAGRYATILKPTGAGACITSSNTQQLEISDLQINTSTNASNTVGIQWLNVFYGSIRRVTINGGFVGCTLAGILIDAVGGFPSAIINVDDVCVVIQCAGDGILLGNSPGGQEDIWVTKCEVSDNAGWGVRVNSSGPSEIFIENNDIEGNIAGAVTGIFASSTIKNNHIEQQKGTRAIVVSGAQNFYGLEISGNTISNGAGYVAGTAGDYCIYLSSVTENYSLVCFNNEFASYSVAGLLFTSLSGAMIGPNYAGASQNMYLYGGSCGGINIIASGNITDQDQQGIIRVFSSNGTLAMLEEQPFYVSTIGAVTNNLLTYTIPDQTACIMKVSVMGRETTSTDFFSQDIEITVTRNDAHGGALASSAVAAAARTAGSGSSCSVAMSLSGNNILVAVTGATGKTYNWGLVYREIRRL